MEIDIAHLQSWIGATRESEDDISPRLANSLAAILDEAPDLKPGDPAPPGIHWCLSPEIAPMASLGPDGHPARGDFLPPVPLPRRMWAGGELVWSGQLRVGDRVTRKSRIARVELKSGRSGPLCFVAVTHEYHNAAGLMLSERHDIVYRGFGAPAPAAANPGPPRDPVLDQIEAGPVLLSRYSGVTFNGHRIHYDRDYCQREEGYPGLLVHGPLQVTYLLRAAQRLNGGQMPARCSYRGTAPLFDGGAFLVTGRREAAAAQLSIIAADGRISMEAEARFAPD